MLQVPFLKLKISNQDLLCFSVIVAIFLLQHTMANDPDRDSLMAESFDPQVAAQIHVKH